MDGGRFNMGRIVNESVMNDIDNVFLRLCWSDSKVSRYDRHKTQTELMGAFESLFHYRRNHM